MKPQDFKKIEDHFTKNGLTVASARFAFSKYIESVGSAMEELKNRDSKDPTDAEIRQICDNYLQLPVLESYLELAKVNQEAEDKNIARKYAKGEELSWWGRSVVISIIGNFLFLVILLLSFAFGRDQWKVILHELDIIEQSVGAQSPPPGGTGTKRDAQ